ncbi:hypothetical protein FRC07_002229, partial [Ceratobasidium sp. 392]
MYPSGTNILLGTVSWPTKEGSYRATDGVRNLFDEKLLEIPVSKKEHAYLSAPGSISTLSAPKDEVLPHDTVSLNENGNSQDFKSTPISDVQDNASAHRRNSSVPKDNTHTNFEHVSVNFSTGLTEDDRAASADVTPAGTLDLIPKHSYITIEEEFDAIPLICFLAIAHGRLICFLDDESALTHYRTLLNSIVSHAIYYLVVAKEPSAVEDAASGFMT